MKKSIRLFPCLLACLFIFSGCSSNMQSDSNFKPEIITATTASGMDSNSFDKDSLTQNGISGDSITLSKEGSAAADVNFEEKLIYTGNISLETLEYDKTIEAVKNYISELKGFIERSDFSSDSGYDYYDGTRYTGSRHASFTIRIPKEKYDDFISQAGDWGVVLSQNSYVENITAQYNDVTLQLESLQIQHDNLIKMMEKAEKLEDMLTIEQNLSNLRWQINSIKSQLKNWDTSVDYSTVNLDINEVKQYTPTEKDSFISRAAKAFKGGISGYMDWLQNVIIDLISSLPFLLTLALIFVIFRKPLKKLFKRKEKYITTSIPNDDTKK